MRKFFVLALLSGLLTACADVTAPDSLTIEASWVEEPPVVYSYGYTGTQIMWTFFEANTSKKLAVTSKIIGGSSVEISDTPVYWAYQVSETRARFRAEVVLKTLKPGITCFQLQIEHGPTTDRCVAVSFSEKGTVLVSPILE